MSAQTRSPSCERLVHVEISPPYTEVTLTIALNLKEMAEECAQGPPPPLTSRSLNQIVHPLIHHVLKSHNLVGMPNLPSAFNTQLCLLNSIEIVILTYF